MTLAEPTALAVNGVELSVTEAGEGPLVVLCHGFPELAYSWRHQLEALAEAGYHAVAPDQRGYGRSSCPAAVEDYDVVALTDDVLALADAYGAERFVVVGHDWGSIVAWTTALRAPERVRGVVGMSVPYLQRPEVAPTVLLRAIFADVWFYILYFQAEGVAEADLERDTATTLRRLYAAISASSGARASAVGAATARDGRGFVERLPEPERLPAWLSEADFDHYVAEFTRTGFRGGLNWYRNLDRNFERTPELAGKTVAPPALFVAGTEDPVLSMSPPDRLPELCDDLRGLLIVEGAGHWVQQEAPDAVNAALIDFLGGLGG